MTDILAKIAAYKRDEVADRKRRRTFAQLDSAAKAANRPRGFRNALNAGLDVLAPLYAATTEVGTQFDEIKAKQGLKAALAWRKAQLEE